MRKSESDDLAWDPATSASDWMGTGHPNPARQHIAVIGQKERAEDPTPFTRFFGIWSTGRGEALFRVGYAAVLLLDLLGLRRKLDLFFATGGAHPTTSLEALYSSGVVHLTYWIWVAVAGLLLLGVWTRAASVGNLLLIIFFFGLRGYVAPHAANWALHAMGFCLVLMRSDRYLTLRRPPWRDQEEQEPVLGWPLRVAQLSYAGIFLTAGLSKLGDPSWRNGSAFPSGLFNPLVSRLDFMWLQGCSTALAVVGVGVVIWELVFPFLLWTRRTRLGAIASGVAFLIGVDLTLRVGWFTWSAIVFSIVFFDDLFPAARARLKVPSRPRLSLPAQAFLLTHAWAFGLAMTGYAMAGLGGRQLQLPVLSEYSRFIAGIHYYNVWPSAYVTTPVRLVTYEARDTAGGIRSIPPFDTTGAIRLGFFSREVREGLLGLRIEAVGMRLSGWKRYAEYVAERYARHYGGDCPSEIRFHGIRSPLSAFGARPKDLQVPHAPLATASFRCPERELDHVALERW